MSPSQSWHSEKSSLKPLSRSKSHSRMQREQSILCREPSKIKTQSSSRLREKLALPNFSDPHSASPPPTFSSSVLRLLARSQRHWQWVAARHISMLRPSCSTLQQHLTPTLRRSHPEEVAAVVISLQHEYILNLFLIHLYKAYYCSKFYCSSSDIKTNDLSGWHMQLVVNSSL